MSHPKQRGRERNLEVKRQIMIQRFGRDFATFAQAVSRSFSCKVSVRETAERLSMPDGQPGSDYRWRYGVANSMLLECRVQYLAPLTNEQLANRKQQVSISIWVRKLDDQSADSARLAARLFRVVGFTYDQVFYDRVVTLIKALSD